MSENQITTAEEFLTEVEKVCGIKRGNRWSGDFEIFVNELDEENSEKFGYFHAHEFFEGDGKTENITFRGVPIKFIEQKGGGEGGSQDCYTVFEILGEYFRADYSYFSHEGFTFEGADFRIVKQVERMVTFYE